MWVAWVCVHVLVYPGGGMVKGWCRKDRKFQVMSMCTSKKEFGVQVHCGV